ncbi:hypothetical protein DV737_g3136, partial [Chaetothyriales sp. CBS 132003]
MSGEVQITLMAMAGLSFDDKSVRVHTVTPPRQRILTVKHQRILTVKHQRILTVKHQHILTVKHQHIPTVKHLLILTVKHQRFLTIKHPVILTLGHPSPDSHRQAPPDSHRQASSDSLFHHQASADSPMTSAEHFIASSSSTMTALMTTAPLAETHANAPPRLLLPADPFHALVKSLSLVLGPSSGLDSADVDPNDLIALMSIYTSNEKEWARYALADPKRSYTRNLVDEGNGKSNLLVLVWNPGKGSPIHDHANAHCVMKILKGSLKETQYAVPNATGSSQQPPQVTKESTYEENEVAYISDNIGLHKMTNGSATEPAVSLHLYTPPHAAHFGFNLFDESTGKRTHIPSAGFYSTHFSAMVKCRGIEVSIISQFDVRSLPEFPCRQTASPCGRQLDRAQSATVSCYVPIYPGSQIWFEYSIDGPHPPKASYFFKLLFNERVITSFGCGPENSYQGKMMYNLVAQGRDTLLGGIPIVRQALFFSNTVQHGHGRKEDVIEARIHRVQHRKRIRQPQDGQGGTRPAVDSAKVSTLAHQRRRPAQHDFRSSRFSEIITKTQA